MDVTAAAVVSLERSRGRRALRACAIGATVVAIGAGTAASSPAARATTAMVAPTQGASVRGQVSLVERPGAGQCDVSSAVVYLEAVGQGVARVASRDSVPGSGLLGTTIAMRGREFIPHVRTVLAGGTVSFPNQDPFSHNVFSNADRGPFDLGL